MLFQTSLGVAFHYDRIHMVCLRGSFRGIQVAGHETVSLDAQKSPQDTLSQAMDAVSRFAERTGALAADLYLGISRTGAVMRRIQLPLAVKENLRATLAYEMEKYVPMPVDQICFDYQILSESKPDNRLDLLLTVVRQADVMALAGIGQHTGLGLCGVELQTTAVVNALGVRPPAAGRDGYILIFGGEAAIELNLVRSGLLVASESLDPAGEPIDEARLRSIFEDMGLQLPEEDLPVVVGGGIDRPEMMDSLARLSGLQPSRLDPSGLGLPSQELVAAYGLALKGFRKPANQVNLLPAGLRKRPSRTAFYAMTLLTILAFGAALFWGASLVITRRQAQARVDRDIRRLSAEMVAIEKIQDASSLLQKRIEAINSLVAGRVPVLEVLTEMARVLPTTAWLTDLSLRNRDVQIGGYADSASDLIGLLYASPIFKDVVFQSAITRDRDGKEQFRIGLKIE